MRELFSAILFFPAIFGFAAISADKTPDANSAETSRPTITVIAKSPKESFGEIFSIIRKVYPNPQFEMLATMSMMQIGYPDFRGVSQTQNTATVFYDASLSGAVAVCADESAVICNTAKLLQIPTLRRGKWLVLFFGNAPQAEVLESRADDAIKSASLKITSLVQAEISPETLFGNIKTANGILDEKHKVALDALANIVSQFENFRLSISRSGDYANLKFVVAGKPKSSMAKFFNETTAREEISELAFLPQDAPYVAASSLNSKKAAEIGVEIISPMLAGSGMRLDIDRLKKMYSAIANTAAQAVFLESFKTNLPRSVEVCRAAPDFDFAQLETFVENTLHLYCAFPKGMSNPPQYEIKKVGETIDGVKTISLSYPLPLYFATVNGYILKTNTLNDMRELIAKVSAEVPSDYPLKKYAKRDAEASLIISGKALLDALSERSTGTKNTIPDNMPPLVVTVRFGKNSCAVSLPISFAAVANFISILENADKASQSSSIQKSEAQK